MQTGLEFLEKKTENERHQWYDGIEMYGEKKILMSELGYGVIKPKDFYRFIFPKGSFEEKGQQQQHKPNGIITVIDGEKNDSIIVLDDLKAVNRVHNTSFAVMSPVGYYGKRRLSSMARYLYAIAIDVDEVGRKELEQIFWDVEHNKDTPRPSLVVLSGRGVHLYYVFKEPVPLYRRNQHRINELKRIMTGHIWYRWTSKLTEREQVQYQSIFQGFRMPGTQSKIGEVLIDGYKTGDKVTLEYLQSFWEEAKALGDLTKYQPLLPIAKAKEKYPKWYQERIVEGKKSGRWHVKRALYDWWLKRISIEAKPGHRYHCLSILATYAIKCDVEFSELERDVFELQKIWEKADKTNIFTRKDAKDALKFFKESFVNFPRAQCELLSGMRLDPNKRNGRKRIQHIQLMNFVRDELMQLNWRNKNGAPKKKEIVLRWREYHPDGRKIDCYRETGLSRITIDKWWNCCE